MQKIYDSHIHCTVGALKHINNILNGAGIWGALVIPFEGESPMLIEESMKYNHQGNLYFAYSIKSQYKTFNDYVMELRYLDDNIKYFKAIKLYKQFSFGECIIGERKFGIMDNDILDDLFQIAKNHEVPIIFHCADPADFWRENPLYRQQQLRNNPQYSYYNTQKCGRSTQLKNKQYILDKYKGIDFICAHLGGFPESKSGLIQNIRNSFIDTSISIEELLYIYGAMSIKKIFEAHSKRIMFGSDLFVLDTVNNMDKIMIVSAIQYLRRCLDIFYSSLKLKVPNFIETPWEIYGLNLSENCLAQIFSGNFERLVIRNEYSSNFHAL